MAPKKARPSKGNLKRPNSKKSPVKKSVTTKAPTDQSPTLFMLPQKPAKTTPCQPAPKPFTFKGHPQPPIDERLFAAKNFLADEDPDRCLDFDKRISEVEELVAQIEKDKAPCDSELFRDVKIKLKVHRDWEAIRKTSLYDTGCCDAPVIAPFSTRLISAETAAAFRREREAQGLAVQMRNDHAPFSTNLEDDHAAFLARMRQDATVDPDLVDQDSNLLWKESRAYLWATRDPALIPYWMHPRTGIPTKGIKTTNQILPNISNSTARNQLLPSRGWLPSYVIATENEINRLLRISDPSSEDFSRLQELLRPYYNPILQRLRKQEELFIDASDLGDLSTEQEAALAQTQKELNIELVSWQDPLVANGVHFIIRASGDPEITQPGVINIDDGVMSPQHIATLKNAQLLLDKLLQKGRAALGDQEAASLDSLLQYSLPKDILAAKKKISQLLLRQGVNDVSDLNDANQLELAMLQKRERELQLRWEESLKQAGGAAFRYLRPGEMRPDENNILYLPWDVTAIPQVSLQLRPDLDLPASVQRLQDEVNRRLAQDDEIRHIDTESSYFRQLLEQLVNPDLRDLLTPYFALQTENKNEEQYPIEAQKQHYAAVAAVVPDLWAAWRHGLGKKITIKMPRRGQPNKTPGLMYCRNPPIELLNEELETYLTRRANEINEILPRYHSARDMSTDDENALLDELILLCDDLQYPALKKLEELYQETDGAEAEKCFKEWDDALFNWLQSKKGHDIRIIVPNGSIDPDDDPSVVYFRGPLLAPENFPELSEDIRNTINVIQRSDQPTFPADLRSQLPPLLRRLIEANDESQTLQSQAVLDWHLQTFMTAQTATSSITPTTNQTVPSSDSPDSDASESRNMAMNEEGSLLTSDSSNSTATKYAQLRTDLALFIPDIRAVEYEINRLLAIFGQDQMSDSDGNSEISFSLLDQLSLHNRLTDLLRQFWPDHVYQRWQRGERFRTMFDSLGPEVSRISTQEYAETIEAYKEDFLTAHNAWLKELLSTKVHIRISPTEVYTPNRTILVFQPEISLKGTGKYDEQTFCIYAPERIMDPYETETSRLVCKVSDPFRLSISYDDKLCEQLAQRQAEINALLEKGASQKLNWEQSESLLHNLRPFMPPDLAELDKTLSELDERARKSMLSGPDLGNWYQMWDVWKDMYSSWLKDLPEEVIIDIADQDQFEAQSGSLRLQIESPWSLPAYDRPTNLPRHLQNREDIINKLASRANSLSASDTAILDQVLAPLFRLTLRRFRFLAGEHIRDICDCTFVEPEDLALMEALVSIAQTIMMGIVTSSTATRTIQLRELVPGTYRVVVVDDSGKPIIPTRTQEQTDLAQKMFEQLCGSHLDASKKEFHNAANGIRTSGRLSQESGHFLRNNISDICSQPIPVLKNRVQAILAREKGVVENDQSQKDLEQAMIKLYWKRLMLTHPDQERKILDLLGNPDLAVRTPALVARRLPGAAPHDPPPLVVPPSEENIKEVEIEINNLIRAEKSNATNKALRGKLNYLLRSLLPPRLRFLKSRFNSLDAQYLARDGLELLDSLQFADVQEQFDRLFQEWKERITGLGIVLDKWLSTPEAISEVCSRAREWEKANFGPNFGNISSKLEDGDVQQCQEIYAAFRRYVEDGCQDGADADDQILLRSAPRDIDYQIKQIQEQTLMTAAAIDNEKIQFAMVLHTMKVQLVKTYMRWLTSLTPMQRQKLRARGISDNSTNFAPKAERRGIQRAAVELALNLLATNQEQHRPKDRFRMVDLPLPIRLPEREVPLCLPLKPEDRPLEQDPLEYTKKMLAFRRWKDYDYDIARVRSSVDRNGEVPPPENFNGPTSIASVDDVHTAARTQVTNLVAIQKALIEAQTTAPRPLLQDLLLLIDAGINYNGQQNHELYDDEILTTDSIDLLEEIAGESWDEEIEEYGKDILGVDNTRDDRGRLQEFEQDVAEMAEQIPLWAPGPDVDAMDEDGLELFQQPRYDPTIASEQYMSIQQVRQIIGDNRLAKSNTTVGPWNSSDIARYLRAMASARRIHINEYDNGTVYVSRIPLGGHPENKYVVSRSAAPMSAGVFRDDDGKLQVRYDAAGRVGPPILQPNKYHYLQRLAFRLGRDTRKNLNVIAVAEKSLEERVEEQQNSKFLAESEMENILPADRSGGPAITNLVDPPPRDITLQRMAHDLLKVAPDLAQQAGFKLASPHDLTEQQAAILLQMQILEEASNNWQWKFPEKEQVWDFAKVRLEKTSRTINGRSIEGRPRLTQFFHMRRFPGCCQSVATQTIIKQSGPTLLEKPLEGTTTEEEEEDEEHSQPQVRHIKGREPYFTLGESAFERAFLSWRMEQELKDVPEFQAPKKRRSWWSFGKDNNGDDQIPKDRYPLPKIPDKWVPDSVSIAEKRAHVLKLAKAQPTLFPNAEILEYYHTPAEIQQIKLQKEWDAFARARQVANDAVEKLTKKKFDKLSQKELRDAYAALGISHVSGLFIDDSKNVPVDGTKAKKQKPNTPAENMKLRNQSGDAPVTAIV